MKKLLSLLTLAAVSALAPHLAAAAPDVEAMQKQFVPVEIKVDLGAMPASERQVLTKLIQVARILDGVYLRQMWAGNPSLLLDLARDDSPAGRTRLAGFLLMKGPWNTQHDEAPFIPGVPARPPQANFYPSDASKADLEAWMAKLTGTEKEAASGFYTSIRRGPDGGFRVVPYSVEYQGELEQAARLLDEAAALTVQPTLKKYLATRAKAFRTNDYYESEVAWMELDASLEPTVGPYETYADGWFNQKAAFEAFITVRDDAATAKLSRFGAELQALENALPIDARFRNPKLGALAPIRVVNQVYVSGDADHGVKTAAYNLPNDERVTAKMGSKRTMLKNVQEAKFQKILLPISAVALSPADQKDIDFDAFFTFILMHELMHGLGPNEIVVGGEKTTPRARLKELYSAYEEAKADISGLWAMQRLVDKGTLPKDMQRTMYKTFLAGAFRTLRFGAADAHGKGMALQVNWLLDRGGFKAMPDGTFTVDAKKMKAATISLTHHIMTLQATGDYAAAKDLLEKQGIIRPEVQKVLDKIAASVPTDIATIHVTASELLSAGN